MKGLVVEKMVPNITCSAGLFIHGPTKRKLLRFRAWNRYRTQTCNGLKGKIILRGGVKGKNISLMREEKVTKDC